MRIESVVANFFPDRFDEGVTTLLDTAMRDVAPGLNEAETESMRVGLRRARAALTAYEEQLHAEFEEWGVTPFDALQVLTELTSDPDGPTTRVRLSSETLCPRTVPRMPAISSRMPPGRGSLATLARPVVGMTSHWKMRPRLTVLLTRLRLWREKRYLHCECRWRELRDKRVSELPPLWMAGKCSWS